jgi:hypothetical protein
MLVRVREGRSWKGRGGRTGSRDGTGSGSRLEDNDDREGYINSIIVRVIEHGKGWGYMNSVRVRVIEYGDG